MSFAGVSNAASAQQVVSPEVIQSVRDGLLNVGQVAAKPVQKQVAQVAPAETTKLEIQPLEPERLIRLHAHDEQARKREQERLVKLLLWGAGGFAFGYMLALEEKNHESRKHADATGRRSRQTRNPKSSRRSRKPRVYLEFDDD